MAERDSGRPGGWVHHGNLPIVLPLDHVEVLDTPGGGEPLELHLVFSDDGLYVPAVVRKPGGPGPFPTIIVLHGGSGGLGISYLVDQMVNRGFVFERLLREGYAVCCTEGRRELEGAYGGEDCSTVLDHQDVITTFRYLQRQSWVDAGRIGFFGASHGGELQLKIISEIREGPAALVAAEPAVIEYLGLRYEGPRNEKNLQFNADLSDSQIDDTRVRERIERISPEVPILVLGRDADHLQGLHRKLHELLSKAGKNAHWATWDHPSHAYHWGPRRTHDGYEADAIQQETLEYAVAFLNRHVNLASAGSRQGSRVVPPSPRCR